MSILDKKGINVTSGFKLISGQPIDARQVVENETELQSIIDNGAAYEGLEVWVKSASKKYRYVGSSFVEVAEGGGGESTNAIIDVDELPKGDWEGTVVPNTGYVDRVYFNTNLSIIETEELLDNLGINSSSFILSTTNDLLNMDNEIFISGDWDTHGRILGISALIEGAATPLYISPRGNLEDYVNATFVGWNPEINFLEIKKEVYSEFSDGGLIGNFNSLFSKVFSTTPFKLIISETNVDTQALYRVKEIESGNITGSTIPTSGFVDTIYYNTSLNNGEVDAILSGLTYLDTPLLGYPLYPILLSADGTPIVIVLKQDNTYHIQVITDMANENFFEIYRSEIGFTENKTVINKEVINEYSGLPIGFENDKLTNLIFTSPLDDTHVTYEYPLYHYKGYKLNRIPRKDKKEVVTFDMKFEVSDNTVTFDDATIFNLKQLFDKIEKNNYKNLRLTFIKKGTSIKFSHILSFSYESIRVNDEFSKGISVFFIGIYSGSVGARGFVIAFNSSDNSMTLNVTDNNVKENIENATFTFYLS